MSEGQPAAAVRHAARRISHFGRLPSRDAKQVDAANNTAAGLEKIRVAIAQDAIQQRAELDGVPGREPQLDGAGPNQSG